MLLIEDIQFEYGGRPILKGLELEVTAGELVGVVGPNGSGKTTLLRLISGVLSPSAGRISVGDEDIGRLGSSQRARLVSIVPQNPQLPLSFRVLDLVLMGRNPHLKLLQWEGRHDMEIARHAMELTETYHLADRRLATLSGGERQRAVIAMALAQEAPVMLLDEPTSNLDLAHQTRVMDLVRDLQERRRGAVLVAMHDLTLASQYCTQLIMLADGRAYARGRPESVLTTENISKVYGTEVFVMPHPQSGNPVVVPAGDGVRGKG